MESIICILGVVKKCYTNNFALIESLWTLREGDIREMSPSLNVQSDSIKAKLFV